MIEPENLRTASLYINNQLLSRGLLRDGQTIDFARPGDTDGEVADTMSRIISVVNDLILRRDRDAEHRESLSTTLRALRAESLRQANDIQRLQDKCAEAQRKVGLSEAAEASLRTQLRSAEQTVHRLKEDAARTRTLVAQTRAACANEVRKRDRQIESLKKAVAEAGRARGAGKGVGLTSITVVGDVGGEGEMACAEPAWKDAGDLRTETNAFLAELAKGLSEENENLLQLIRRTVGQLKDMSGWDAVMAGGSQAEQGDGHALVLAANPADLALEVDAVLEHLRTILTNPSFVPIEEVVVREDEIHRLRDGWEKMESRWKEAVHLIDGWRRRMQASGRPVNVEELKMGLRLSPVKVKNVAETAHGYNLKLESEVEEDEEEEEEEGEMEEEEEEDDEDNGVRRPRTPRNEGPLDLVLQHGDEGAESDASGAFDEDEDVDVDVDDLDVEEPNVEILQQSFMMPLPPYPLRETRTSANRGPRPQRPPTKRSRLFPAITEEKTHELAAEEPPLPPPPPPPHLEKPHPSPSKRPLLSLRTVPPEEAAEVALPPSAALSAPDTWVDSPSESIADQRAAKTSAPAKDARPAAAAKRREPALKKKEAVPPPKRDVTTRREAAVARRKEAEVAKPAVPSRMVAAKPRPTRPPITRGRSEARPDEKQAPSSRQPRAPSVASASSARSAPAGGRRTAEPAPTASPTRRPNPSPAPSPTRSPQRVNSRLPLPRPDRANSVSGGSSSNDKNSGHLLPPPQQSPVNMAAIAAKLAASEREADAARVRAKLKAAKKGGVAAPAPISLPPPGASTSGAGEEADADGAAAPESASTSASSSACSSLEGRPRSAATAATTVSSHQEDDRDEDDEVDRLGAGEEEDGQDGREAEGADEEVDVLGLPPPVSAPAAAAASSSASLPSAAEVTSQARKLPAKKQQPPVQKRAPQRPVSAAALAPTKRTTAATTSSSLSSSSAAAAAAAASATTTTTTTTAAAAAAPRKRERRPSKAAGTRGSSRRRSTLSPWELDALIQGGTVAVDR
ncbi:hypothetical protein VTJ83DRAFT_7203 [Remersonia thermophila]|uniref:NIMA interactive protein n=1 Tax=Remersonia thermophila TaxID=72144 RepID=A0ABR4D2Y9_9PEZI